MIGVADSLVTPSQGAFLRADQHAVWRVWAPTQQALTLRVYEREAERFADHSMERTADGHFTWQGTSFAGQRYSYVLDRGRRVLPDPASRWQPAGVHRPSAIVDFGAWTWSDASWQGIRLADLVIYELHVGTFTTRGTFEAAIPRLAALRDLGVTAIELMPVAQFSGARNWGYDGVHPCAVQNTYGGPQGLAQFIDAAHRAGLAVLIDAVYNHLGPEGNYFPAFGPYFTDQYHTPWGQALNFDGPESDPVRKLVLDSATMWIRDYHADGLRLDAVQAIHDNSAKHILAELQEVVREIGREQRRATLVIAETNQNDVRLVTPAASGGYGLDGVWSDDFHHCVHALLTGERDGYYQDFGTPAHLAKALREVFVYNGCYSPHHRRRHGNRVGELAREHFVCCTQNHDQIGNRPLGDRLASTISPAEQGLATALLLLAPTVPLLFMGEEYGETRPFPFFCSFEDSHLIEAVRRGRRNEMASVRFNWRQEPPDPHAEATFAAARLSWNWTNDRYRSGLRNLYADLLKARRTWPALRDRHVQTAEIVEVSGAPCLYLELGRDKRLCVWANLSCAAVNLGQRAVLCPTAGDYAARTADDIAAQSPRVARLFSSADEAYGGQRSAGAEEFELAAWECAAWGPATWAAHRQPQFQAERA